MKNVLLNTKLLKSKRKEKRLTMLHMANVTGYKDVYSYCAVEKGDLLPSLLRAKRIATELKLDVNELIVNGKPSMKKSA